MPHFYSKNISVFPFELAGSGVSVHACHSQLLAASPVEQPVRSLQNTYSDLKSWQVAVFGKMYMNSCTAWSASSGSAAWITFSHDAFNGNPGSGPKKLAGYG